MHVHLFIENNIIDFLMKVVYNEMTQVHVFMENFEIGNNYLNFNKTVKIFGCQNYTLLET